MRQATTGRGPALNIQLRVLAAMLSQPEFTAEDLAAVANVKLASVRTVLQRRSDDVETIGMRSRTGPGGRAKVYRLRAGVQDRLRADLDPLTRTVLATRSVAKPGIPASIVAVHDLLVRQVSEVPDDELAGLIRTAGLALGAASADAAVTNSLHDALIELERLLLELARLELEPPPRDSAVCARIGRNVLAAARRLVAADAPSQYVSDLYRRALTGPAAMSLIDNLSHSQPRSVEPAASRDWLSLADSFPCATAKFGIERLEDTARAVRDRDTVLCAAPC